MNIRSGLSFLGLSLALACGGGGGYSSSGGGYTPPAGPPANTVWVGGTGGAYGGGGTSFNPATLTVSAGTTVTFLWKANATHNVTSYTIVSTDPNSKAFTSSGDHSNSGDSYTYTFATAGTYYYYCTYHGTQSGSNVATGMSGKVVVN